MRHHTHACGTVRMECSTEPMECGAARTECNSSRTNCSTARTRCTATRTTFSAAPVTRTLRSGLASSHRCRACRADDVHRCAHAFYHCADEVHRRTLDLPAVRVTCIAAPRTCTPARTRCTEMQALAAAPHRRRSARHTDKYSPPMASRRTAGGFPCCATFRRQDIPLSILNGDFAKQCVVPSERSESRDLHVHMLETCRSLASLAMTTPQLCRQT